MTLVFYTYSTMFQLNTVPWHFSIESLSAVDTQQLGHGACTWQPVAICRAGASQRTCASSLQDERSLEGFNLAYLSKH